MADTTTHQYEPDYAVYPGEILEETLEDRGMKVHPEATDKKFLTVRQEGSNS